MRLILILALILSAHQASAQISITKPGGGGGEPEGNTTEVQFNDAGVFNGASGLTITSGNPVFGGAADAANTCKWVSNGFECEGATANAFETSLLFGDATADASLTLTGVANGVNITNVSRIAFAGTAPAVSSCGTSPSVVTGNDHAGRLTTGSGGTVQSCTLTFNVAYSAAPSCICNSETSIILVRATATTTTLVCDAAVAGNLESKVINYVCMK